MSRIETIAPLPQSVLEIVSLTNDPDVDLGAIERAAAKDPVLTARFFKLANSAFLQGVEKVTSISDAVRRLGIKTIRNLAIATGARASMTSTGSAPDRQKLWLHSISCALASQEVSSRLGHPQERAANLFLAGLMHDVGRLAFEGIVEGANEAYLHTTVEDENQTCGIDHPEMSVRLMREWALPTETIAIVDAHHAEGLSDLEDPLGAAVLRLVDPWIQALDETKPLESGPEPEATALEIDLEGLLAKPALEVLGLDAAGFLALADGVPEYVFRAVAALEGGG